MTTEPASPLARPISPLAIVAIIAAVLLPLVGIVLGIVVRRQVSRTGEGGAGLATAAIVIGIVITVIALAVVGLATGILMATGQLVGVDW